MKEVKIHTLEENLARVRVTQPLLLAIHAVVALKVVGRNDLHGKWGEEEWIADTRAVKSIKMRRGYLSDIE